MNPPQLPPPPRKIRRRREAGGAWLLWSVVVGGMVTAFVPLLLVIARNLVLSSGRVVEATVDDVYIVRTKNGDTPHVRFHYSLAGRVVSADQEVVEAERQMLPPRKVMDARVKVFFGWPYCFLMVPSVDTHSTLRILVAVGTPLGAWAVAWIVYGQDFRDRKLVRKGTPGGGVITGHRSSGGQSSKRYVEFQFTTALGVEVIGEMQTDAWAYAIALIGDPVTVLYEPRRPWNATLLELCTYEISMVRESNQKPG